MAASHQPAIRAFLGDEIVVDNFAGGGGASSGEDPLDVLSVAEAAKLLRVGKASLYSALAAGTVPHRKIGRHIRISRAALVRWFESWSQESARRGT